MSDRLFAMLASALMLTVLLQGVPVAPGQGATVAGVLRASDGLPAPGVRIAAMARPDALADAVFGSALSGITVTDTEGRYKLENIPPGQYFIVAGRLDFPTFYPGTQEITRAKEILIAPGAAIEGIDFVMRDTSVRIADPANNSGWTIPFRVRVEGGGKLPFSSPAGTAELRVARADGVQVRRQLDASSITVPPPAYFAPVEYKVTADQLPEGYSIKSIALGSAELIDGVFKLSSRMITSGTLSEPLTITLNAPTFRTPSQGQRVAGRVKTSWIRSVYLSGVQGLLYNDGSFEFRGVLPGRYVITTPDNPTRPSGALIEVGDRDIEGIELEEIAMLPSQAPGPIPGRPPSDKAAGPIVPLPTLRGRVLELNTRRPVEEGTIILTGASKAEFAFTAGKYEIPRLLPGSYKLEIQVFGHANLTREIVVGDQDIQLDLSPERFY